MFFPRVPPLHFSGASAGIGVETARVLALRGAHVVMAVRNMAAGAKVKDNITSQIPDAKVPQACSLFSY